VTDAELDELLEDLGHQDLLCAERAIRAIKELRNKVEAYETLKLVVEEELTRVRA